MTSQDMERLVTAAWWYYMDGVTQSEVAQRLGISRASAGRLLERCRTTGVVSVSIASSYLSQFNLAAKLREKYGLDDCVVIPDANMDSPLGAPVRDLALGAVQVLAGLGPISRIAIGWGEAVAATVAQLPVDFLNQATMLALTGGVNEYAEAMVPAYPSTENRHDQFVPTPIVVSTKQLAEALRAEASVAEALSAARHADAAIVGIGPVVGTPTLHRRGYASAEELREYAAMGAVGDVLGMFFDADGCVVDLEIHARRIGIDIAELRTMPNVIGIAGGSAKVAALRAALRGDYLDILVTDKVAALGLLEDS